MRRKKGEMSPNRLDLSKRRGIAVGDIVEALDAFQKDHGRYPDTLILPGDAAPPIVSKIGRWGTFRGIPIMYMDKPKNDA
jgi:hypothetical protein